MTESVFTCGEALSPEFLPDELPGREKEIQEIAFALKPATQKKPPQALFVYGRTGVGKTSCVKKVSLELENSFDAKIVYVNCWQNYTRQSILNEVARSLGEALPRRGLAGDEIFSRIIQSCKHSGLVPVIVLDEVDQLFARREEKILYELTRAHEQYGTPLGLACITNDFAAFSRLDDRVRSAFIGGKIEFKPYNPLQLKKILRERAKQAFAKGACDEEAIALCVAFAAKQGGDARIAIKALWLAGRNADARGARKVAAADARKALRAQEEKTAAQEKKESRLNESEKKILLLVKKRMTSSRLYAAASKAGIKMSERSIREYVGSLREKGLLKVSDEYNPGGKPGYTRLIERT